MPDSRPVLDAIRSILKFKDFATINDIARYSGLTPRLVLDTINANGAMVWRDRKNGRITKVDPRAVHRQQLVESGAYYFSVSYGAWSHEGYCLKFKGNDELRKTLETRHLTGGIGDSWHITKIEDTPENRAALEAAGLMPWAESEADERLWRELAN